MRLINSVFSTVCLLAVSLSAGETASVPTQVGNFFKSYCYECHDAATSKAKLSIESLAPNFLDSRWIRIHDRVIAGEMPPKKKKQPSPEDVAAVTQWLNVQLHDASLARQKTQGRVGIRRHNRYEYENAMRDLLGAYVPLKELLPEDNIAGGFDTVSTGLETSAMHLVRFQDAADRALEAALPAAPSTELTIRQSGEEFLALRPKPNREGVLPFIRIENGSFVIFASIYKHMSIHTPPTPRAGLYRIRASIHSVNTGGKSLPALVGLISSDRFAHEKLQHILDVYDAPAKKPRVVEVEAVLAEREQVYIEPWNVLPSMKEFPKALATKSVQEYDGPGLAVDWMEITGPIDPDRGCRQLFDHLPRMPRRVVDGTYKGDWSKWNVGEFIKSPLVAVSNDPKADAQKLIARFVSVAFRRPVDRAVVDYYVGLVQEQLDKGERFDDAMRTGYKAILCSPYFLMFLERPGALDDYAIAARLAHFLWSSVPDEELLTLAAQGELHKPAVLRAQTERMLNDVKGHRFTETFTGQWLDLRKFQDMKPDAVYAEFDDKLSWSMPKETVAFFDEVLKNDLPVSSFVQSDWSFLNDRLGTHYGIAGIEGIELRKVKLPAAAHRGGVITQASILKLTTNATYTSPVKRGAWFLDRIIGKPPAPPPPDAGAIEPDIRGAVTIRQQLAKHKSVAVCASCHLHIDPPGFALENFDVVGGWRDFYRAKQPPQGAKYVDLPNYPGKKVWQASPVEAGGESDAGEHFDNIDQYKQLILKDQDQLVRNMVQKLLVFSTGAEIQFADREVVEQIVASVRQKHGGLRSIIHEIVQSRIFLNK